MQITNCAVAREAMAAVTVGNFSDEDVKLVELHTAACSACAGDYKALSSLVEILPQPERDAEFNKLADATARRTVNAVRHISDLHPKNGILRITAFFRGAAILLAGFGLGFATIKNIESKSGQLLFSQASNRAANDYIDFLERSHLLLLGAASCKPDCSVQDFELASHQKRISIELLLEAQNIRKLPDVRLRPQELRLIENIENALTQVVTQGMTEKDNSVREESGTAVCEISRRLGM